MEKIVDDREQKTTCARVAPMPVAIPETDAAPHAHNKGVVFGKLITYWRCVKPWFLMFVLLLLGFLPVLERLLNASTQDETFSNASNYENDTNASNYENDDENDGGESSTTGFFGSSGILPVFLLPLHIIVASTMNIIGPLQFNPAIRRRWRNLHRRLGYVYIPCAVGAGLTAILITLINPARYVWLNIIHNLLFGAWLLGSTVVALVFIRRSQIKRHQRWMIRSFGAALTVAVHRAYGSLINGSKLEIKVLDGALQDFLLSTIVVTLAEVLARKYRDEKPTDTPPTHSEVQIDLAQKHSSEKTNN